MNREQLAAKRAQHVAALEAITATAVEEGRGLTDDEQTKRSELRAAVVAIDERDAELAEQETREAATAAQRVRDGETNVDAGTGRARVTSEPAVYRKGGENSWFGDLARAAKPGTQGAVAAADRLARGSAQALEERAVDMTTVAGAGGEFAPPLWLVDEFVALARAGRVTADLVGPQNLPAGVSSINLPKVATGTTVANQTEGNAVSETAATTTSVSSGIRTTAGAQRVSLQLLEQSGISMDSVVLNDLAAAYAVALDANVLAANDAIYKGIINVSSIGTVTYTDASPAVAGAGKFYAMIAKALQTVATTRFLPATSIVMHPRRWAWVTAAFDTQNRPLVVPTGAGFNVVATGDASSQAQGAVGEMQGVPVYTDPNITTNNGGGTEDYVLVLREADLNLYETPLAAASFDATFATTLEVLFRVHAYNAFIGSRYPASICKISGTGLVTPSF